MRREDGLRSLESKLKNRNLIKHSLAAGHILGL